MNESEWAIHSPHPMLQSVRGRDLREMHPERSRSFLPPLFNPEMKHHASQVDLIQVELLHKFSFINLKLLVVKFQVPHLITLAAISMTETALSGGQIWQLEMRARPRRV